MTNWTLHHGDCREVLRGLTAESLDAVVTDPPYSLGFMGKAWDRSGIANDPAMWAAVLHVLKPGAYVLAFGGTRTYHRMACAVEDAGFVVKDSLMWLYGSGFPKSLNLGDGIGTALKPGYEPIVLAQKPLQGTYVANLARWGVGGLNIDGCRIESQEQWQGNNEPSASMNGYGPGDGDGWQGNWTKRSESHAAGRWPANVILDEAAGALLDAQSGTRKSGAIHGTYKGFSTTGIYGEGGTARRDRDSSEGGASRFFYCAKASRSERDAGLDALPLVSAAAITDSGEGSARLDSPRTGAGRTSGGRNTHPTVKPLSLMRWLVRLVTPDGGIVLDPFAGSGTTLCAAILEGRSTVGIEMTEEYLPLIRGRATHAERQAILPLGVA